MQPRLVEVGSGEKDVVIVLKFRLPLGKLPPGIDAETDRLVIDTENDSVSRLGKDIVEVVNELGNGAELIERVADFAELANGLAVPSAVPEEVVLPEGLTGVKELRVACALPLPPPIVARGLGVDASVGLYDVVI